MSADLEWGLMHHNPDSDPELQALHDAQDKEDKIFTLALTAIVFVPGVLIGLALALAIVFLRN